MCIIMTRAHVHTHTHTKGAMFSIIAVAQVLASIVASVLFGTTYPKILKEGWRPGAIYWVMSLLIAIEIPFAM